MGGPGATGDGFAGSSVHPPRPGLAGVRTALAWQRSLLLVAATALAIAKHAGDGGRLGFGVTAAGVLLLLCATFALVTARGQVVRPDWADHRRRALQALTALAVLAAVLSLVTLVVAS